MTTTEASLMPLVLHLGRTAAAGMDVPAVLASVCTTVPHVVGVAGAVVLLADPPALAASDQHAMWIGEQQQRAEMGPLPGALRTGRPMLTADLTRIGPPALAAVAAECGLVSSLALPIEYDGERLGAFQLLGEAERPVELADADTLRPLLAVLAARLVDFRAFRTLYPAPRMPSPRRPKDVPDVANTCEATTRSLPVVTPRPAPASSSTTPRSFAPPLAAPHAP